MRPREIAHRLRDRGRCTRERLGLLRPAEAPAGFGNYLRGEPSRRFYAGPREALDRFAREWFPQWIERAEREAEALCRHEVELLNLGPVALGPEIDWHRDPVTGRVWEKRFWSDYRLEDSPAGVDAKIIHELNRQQHLPRLAKAYRLTGRERYAAEAVAQMVSWIEQNPPGAGVNWQSSLEIAIRCVSWLWTLFLLQPGELPDEIAAQAIGDSLFAQMDHVYRHTSQYSSPNTHLLGEGAALFIAGTVFRDRKRAAAWMDAGWRILEEEARRQIGEDGVHRELSSYYHCYALDFYLQALVLGRQNGVKFSPQVWERVRGMAEFLMHVTKPDGSIALLGDDDGGRALALRERTYRSFRDGLGTAALLLGQGDLLHQAGEFAEETWLLLGGEAWDAQGRLEREEPEAREIFFSSAGYYVQRSGWGAEDSHMVFDCGGLGMLTGGHSHADALAVTLHAGGRDLLVDPGTFVYNGGAEWRRYFRSTAAHNTVTVDGRDQAAMGGSFAWKSRMHCRASIEDGGAVRYIEAEHDGYGPEVRHRRRLLSLPGEYWLLLDDFEGSGRHTFRFHYTLGPEVEVTALERRLFGAQLWAEAAGLSVAMCASAPVEPRLGEGWASAGYGERHPAPALEVSLTAAAPARAVTFLAATGRRPVLRRVPVAASAAVACIYEAGEYRDIVVLSGGDAEMVVEGFRLRGKFFWLRMQEDVLVKPMAIDAAGMWYGGQDLLENPSCAQFAAF